MDKMERVRKYIKSIRNTEKACYATNYMYSVVFPKEETEPFKPENLSAMAAQAVRMRVDELLTQ